MWSRESFSYSRLAVVSLCILVFLSLAAFGVFIVFDFGSAAVSNPSQKLVQSGQVSASFWNVLRSWRDWSSVFEDLERERLRLDSLQAEMEILNKENQSLRSALGLNSRFKFNLIGPAGAFGFRPAPLSQDFMINKGEKDGIKVGDVVISDAMVLLGRVKEVREDFSIVSDIKSTDSQVTAKILNKETQGLIKGSSNDMIMDLVTQNDDIVEGDIAVSSGNDNFPAGLIIGEVYSISPNSTDIFKGVRVKSIESLGYSVFIISI